MLQRDIDPQETREWLEAFDAVVEHDGSTVRSICSSASSATLS